MLLEGQEKYVSIPLSVCAISNPPYIENGRRRYLNRERKRDT